MKFLKRILIILFIVCCSSPILAEDQVKVPILVYHRFGPTARDSMTLKTSEFESQLKWLKENNYHVIPLKELVNYLRGEGPPPPPKSVVITADDGHKSVFSDMQPLVKKYHIPVTLFIYPLIISRAHYAMTWEQLRELQQTGLFDIQGHTYWHPNFKQEKKKLSPVAYQKLVDTQLNKSKAILEKELNIKVIYLAWPFGIYDDYLEKEAAKDGYVAAFSIKARYAKKSENMMSQPRYMIIDGLGFKRFETIVANASRPEINKSKITSKKIIRSAG